MKQTPPLQNVPTNIITGFLGVGKTTAIQHLLQQKPEHERWAVLVNEFGEVGIDESLLGGPSAQERGVYIRQVPGGCMCCAAGLPMQIALNMLLSRSKPDRLLIEPTGLGHPKEVVGVLSNSIYKTVLDLRATVTLVDARKLSDTRYTGNATFKQQLAIADLIIANKCDLYQAQDLQNLHGYLQQDAQLSDKPLFEVTQGALQLSWLDRANAWVTAGAEDSHRHKGHAHALPAEPEMPACGYLRIDNEGEGFHSSGWVFEPRWVFDGDRLYQLLSGLAVDRLKAVFITNDGVLGFNQSGDVLTSLHLDDAVDSRVELITDRPELLQELEELEEQLLDCLINR